MSIRFGKGMKTLPLKVVLLAGVISLACTTRVSEWVLLNAAAEKYSLVCHYPTTYGDAAKDEVRHLKERFGLVNLEVALLTNKEVKAPYYELFYRNRFFAKYEKVEELAQLAVSPMRKKIAMELMEGKLCVLLLLKSGDPVKDELSHTMVDRAVALSPFRDIIVVMDLERKSQEERHLAMMLLNVEEDLKEISEPMLFGIFGKMKALEPLLAKGISEENIHLMIQYLVAECSCLIKDDLPGTDMLYSGSWENPKPALLNKIIDANPALFVTK